MKFEHRLRRVASRRRQETFVSLLIPRSSIQYWCQSAAFLEPGPAPAPAPVPAYIYDTSYTCVISKYLHIYSTRTQTCSSRVERRLGLEVTETKSYLPIYSYLYHRINNSSVCPRVAATHPTTYRFCCQRVERMPRQYTAQHQVHLHRWCQHVDQLLCYLQPIFIIDILSNWIFNNIAFSFSR